MSRYRPGGIPALVAEALTRGVVVPIAIADAHAVSLGGVQMAMMRACDDGRAVRLWKGVYARPELAEAIRAVIAAHMPGAM
jgi:hypothetical protein